MGSVICVHQALCFLFSFLHFLVISSSLSTQPCPVDQSLALIQFSNTFTIDCIASSFHGIILNPKVISWKEGTDCCSWDGVTCDRLTGHVIGLDLSDSCLFGKIHSNNSLFLLRHLHKLNLANNHFKNSLISPEFGRFTSLKHLNLSNSQFDGLVPSEISLLSKLVSLDLSFNSDLRIEQDIFKLIVQNLTETKYLHLDFVDMSLVVPSSFLNLSSSLISLSMKDAGLQGNFPDNVFHLPYLQELRLFKNYGLTGTFPKSNWSNSLYHLDLSSTSFIGELPDSIGNLKSLKSLKLARCKLTKSIPASLGNLTQITFMDLSFNNFIGPIPSSLSNLVQLTYLKLSHNNFSGHIPDVFGNFSKITSLFLSQNNFSGQLPSSVFNLEQLERLDFSANKLEGPLPYQVSGLSNLTSLFLNGNLLSGRIPSWLFTLPSLQILYLMNNKLIGPIDQFQQPSALTKVCLRNNEIHGSIPSSIFYLLNLTYLDISSNNLSGIIEPHMLSKLENLQGLYLSNNNLLSLRGSSSVNFTLPNLVVLRMSSCNISEFPNFLSTLESLGELHLSNNQIAGRISKWDLEGWQSLNYLNLSYNFLTGLEQLPGQSLETADLRYNLLQGAIPIPPSNIRFLLLSNNNLTEEISYSLCNMSSIEVLDLSNNSLSGLIPVCLGNCSNSFSVLDLRMNRFIGTIPGTFANGSYLRTLNFNHNRLEGPVPRSLVNCTMLEVLDLGNNMINDTFPYWLGTLPELQVLVLHANKFHGFVSGFQANNSFPKLRIFDLSNNNFNGLLPTSYFESLKAMMNVSAGKLQYMGETYYQDSVTVIVKGLETELVKILTIFTTIDFSSNSFHGEIPELIGQFCSLRLLNFSRNSLTGHIPSSLGNLKALESLDLSSNKLDGEIPRQLTNLTFLSVLNLSQNQLEGTIPGGNQFDTFQNDSYSGNLGLCGVPLSKKCGTAEAPQPLPPKIQQNDSESANGFGWKAVLTGYGFGILFGLVMGYLVFSTRKPQWLVRIIEGERGQKGRKLNYRRGGRRNQ